MSEGDGYISLCVVTNQQVGEATATVAKNKNRFSLQWQYQRVQKCSTNQAKSLKIVRKKRLVGKPK